MVDCKNYRLCQLDPASGGHPAVPVYSSSHTLSELSISRAEQLQLLLRQYRPLFQSLSNETEVIHPVQHHIVTEGPPCFARSRRLFGEKLRVTKETFNRLESEGVIYRGEYPWATPLHMVPKPGKDNWRPCGDSRQLNVQTVPDRYPMPNLSDITNSFHGCQVFSKLDLVSAFHQIPVALEDQPKTAITTPFGLFLFRRMPFGLRNASQTFQRLVDIAFQDMPFAQAYIDDIIVASTTPEEHFCHLRRVLQRLQQYNLRLREDKCELFKEQVRFVGVQLSKDLFRPIPEKVEAIDSFPNPTTVRGLKRFLGMAAFYHRFVPKFSDISAPLTDLTRNLTRPTKVSIIQWNDTANAAFDNVKQALKNAVQLSFPCPTADLELTTDAYGSAVGAVLHQVVDGNRSPLAFYSKTLTDRQSKKSAYDRELYAIFQTLRYFSWLLGMVIIIRTDHKPLVHALSMKSATPQQSRWLSYISQFDCSIQHIAGKENQVADTLSRTTNMVNALSFLSSKDLATAQSQDVALLKFFASTSLPVKHLTVDGEPLWCDDNQDRLRPCVPKSMRREMFDRYHGLSHPGTRKTLAQISSDYVWPGINKDVREWCRTCQACQSSNIGRHTKAPVGTIPTSGRFETIHVDIVGPLPPSEGHRYLLTVIDRFTQWPEVIPIPDMSTETVALALTNGWICRFGIPRILITDRGSQFESPLWQSLMLHLGIERRRTTSYHPACNGAIERFHSTLKAALRATCKDCHWIRSLPLVLLGLRTSLKKEGYSPAQLVYGSSITLPGQYFLPDSEVDQINDDFVRQLFAHIRSLPAPERHHSSPSYVSSDLQSATDVWLRDFASKSSLAPRYRGPYQVISRTDKTFTIDQNGSSEVVSIDRTTPAYLSPRSDDDQTPASDDSAAPHRSNLRRDTAFSTAQPSDVLNFPVGRVVIAKFPGYPPWSAHIVDASNTRLAGRRHPAGALPLQFFGTNKYAYVPPSDMQAFNPHLQTQHSGVRRAIKLALDHLNHQLATSTLSSVSHSPHRSRVTFGL